MFAFTDHDEDITVLSVLYLASTAYKRTAIQDSAGLNVDNLDVEGAFVSESILEEDLRAGKWDYAHVEVFIVNWDDLTQGKLKQRKGRLGEVQGGRTTFTAELRGLAQNVQQVVGRLVAPSCDADVGDARCGVNLATYTVTGSITTKTNNRAFTSAARGEAADWFKGGKITFTSGLNIGLPMEIKSFVATAFILQLPMPYSVTVGDTYSMTPGCQKRMVEDCITKYNNVVNFRGFPDVPGIDNLQSGGL